MAPINPTSFFYMSAFFVAFDLFVVLTAFLFLPLILQNNLSVHSFFFADHSAKVIITFWQNV